MWRLNLFLVIGVIALLIYGVREYMLGRGSGSEPAAISIEELEAGVPDNPYRRLGPHIAVFDNVVYSQRKRGGSDSVQYAYYPAVSKKALDEAVAKFGKGAGDAAAAALLRTLPIKVIVKTRRWKSVDEIKAEVDRQDSLFRTELVGTVINRIDSIGTQEVELLKGVTPNFDPKTTVIIEEDRKPTAPALAMGLIAAGVVLAVAPLPIWLIRRRRQTKPQDVDSNPE
jgi:hypothetical protein